MERFGIMLKSYGPDLPYAERFVDSWQRFATEPIPLAVVVPDIDVPAFTRMLRGRGEVLPESLWEPHLVDYRIHGNSPGYMNQQIIKLAFAELGMFRNYLCADSEAEFIRPFSSADFMASGEVPFTFVTEDHELAVDPAYERAYGAARRRMLLRLRDELGLRHEPLATCHNMAVFNAEVLASLRAYLAHRGLTYATALELCPYEFSWYNFWLERDRTIDRITREPIFLMLHLEHQHLELALHGIGTHDLARGYVGVLVNSGFSRAHGVVDFTEPRYRTLGRYVSYRAHAAGIIERCLRRTPRLARFFRSRQAR